MNFFDFFRFSEMRSSLNSALEIIEKSGVVLRKWPGSEFVIKETIPGELEVFCSMPVITVVFEKSVLLSVVTIFTLYCNQCKILSLDTRGRYEIIHLSFHFISFHFISFSFI